MPDVSNPPGLTESGDVDHDETSNRTHDGDDLSPATLEADKEFVPPVVATKSDLPDPASVPEGAETTVLNDPNGEVSVYKVVDQ